MDVANKLLILRPPRIQADSVAACCDGSSAWKAQTHPELLLEPRSAGAAGRQDAADVAVQLPGGHLRLSAEDGLHQGIVYENILLLTGNMKQ